MQQTAIELKGISKSFGSIKANDNISLSVKKGEILALLGENGSGKTTLMNVLSGIYSPDSGTVFIDGRPVVIKSPEDAKKLGIGMIHQHFKLVENFSAADNIWLGVSDTGTFLTRRRYEKIRQLSRDFGFDIDPEKMVYDMSVSEKQTVEILKVLCYGANILILDEPTAVLTVQEIRKLFSVLRKMRDAGCAVIIITHKLNEVMEISDRVTILRKGKSVGTVETAQTNTKQLTELMVGDQVSLSIDRPEPDFGQVLLDVHEIDIKRDDGSYAAKNVSFTVRSGEILGVAGVSGCGQKEICDAIAGLQSICGGAILYKNQHIDGKTPREIIDCGISMSFIPEDRLGMGLAASLSITDNMILKNYRDAKGPFVDRVSARKQATDVIEELGVVTPSTETPVRMLSGGNVQKVLLGREIKSDPTVLVTAYPVRGLDINSSYTIYNILNEQKKKGTGVLFVGEDLDVMLELCDRILVLCHGEVTGIVNASETNKEELGLMMTGAKRFGKISDDPSREAKQPEEEKDTASAEYSFRKPATDKPSKKRRFPLHVVKRSVFTPWKTVFCYLFAIVAAMLVGGVIVLCMGKNPIQYYGYLVSGCFSSPIYINNYIRIVTPLIITSIGVAVSYKMRFWNIGANGQFIMGAIAATTVAFAFNGSLPRPLMLTLMAVAGAVGGGLFGAIVAFFKIKWNTNETLMTLMFNYIAQYILAYLKKANFYRKFNETTGQVLRPDIKSLPENAWLYEWKFGKISIDLALVAAVIIVILVAVYLKKTKHGYEISVVGDSVPTARYAGMNVNRVILRTMFISAAIIGLAGMLKVTGSSTVHTLSDGITSDVGWTAIIVAWIAKLNPVGITVASLLMGMLQKGSGVVDSRMGISSAASSILEGVILFTVLAADFFIRYKIVRVAETETATAAVTSGEGKEAEGK